MLSRVRARRIEVDPTAAETGVLKAKSEVDLGEKRNQEGWALARGRSAFPGKANPNRPVRSGVPTSSSRDALCYPVKCDPMGSREPLSEEQRGLASRYLPMAQALAKGCKAKRIIERDELESTAYLALVEAAKNFDPARNVSFATYARHHIEGRLQDCKRFWNSGWGGDQELRPMFQRLGKNADLHGQVIGRHPELPVGAVSESIEAVEEWLASLPPLHAWACRLIYVYGMSPADAADQLGYSRSYFSRMHKEALSHLVEQGRAELDDSKAPPKLDDPGHAERDSAWPTE